MIRKFKGKIWHNEKGELTDKFLDWLSEKKKFDILWGKQCICKIELVDPLDEIFVQKEAGK